MPEKEGYNPEHEKGSTEQERIEEGIWRPGILEKYSDKVAATASTKALRRTEEVALRILGDPKRFERPMKERIRAGRILAELRNEIDSEIDLHHIVKGQLAHGGEVKKVDEAFVQDLIKGNLDKKQIARTDGLITNLKGYPLYVSAADCYPVGVYDPEHEAIGAFHNGSWGLIAKICENGIEAMKKEYGTDPEKLVVTIAPGVTAETYVIDEKAANLGKEKLGEGFEKFITPGKEPGTYHLDLRGAIISRLEAAGVKPENIEVSQYSTDKNNELFPSERIEGNKDRDSYGFMIALK